MVFTTILVTLFIKSQQIILSSFSVSKHKVQELLVERPYRCHIMSGLWQRIKKHLMEEFIQKPDGKKKLRRRLLNLTINAVT